MRDEPRQRAVVLNGVELTLIRKTELDAYARQHAWARRYIKEGDYEIIIPGWYLYTRNLNKGNVCDAAGLGKTGQYDAAVPQDWLDHPENKRKWKAGEWAVWYYPRTGRDRIFGRPVWKSEIWRTIRALLRRKLGA